MVRICPAGEIFLWLWIFALTEFSFPTVPIFMMINRSHQILQILAFFNVVFEMKFSHCAGDAKSRLWRSLRCSVVEMEGGLAGGLAGLRCDVSLPPVSFHYNPITPTEPPPPHHPHLPGCRDGTAGARDGVGAARASSPYVPQRPPATSHTYTISH
jgi:hypothetical protein